MILKLGSSGHYVELLQKALGITVDGVFGPLTQTAVKSFQASHGLTVDGIVGPVTESALIVAYKGGVVANPAPITAPITGAPVPLPSGKGPLYGVDIYHGDEPNFPAMVAGGLSFCFIKASESMPDSKFPSFYPESKSAGLKTGAYHFMNWGVSGAAQAQLFKSCVDGVGGILPDANTSDWGPMIDWEYSDGRNPTLSDVQEVKDFSSAMYGFYPNRKQILYLSESVYVELVAMGYESWLSTFVIFVAEYGVSKPKGGVPWTIWQTAEDAHIPGLGNPGDSDVFNGSIDDLNKL